MLFAEPTVVGPAGLLLLELLPEQLQGDVAVGLQFLVNRAEVGQLLCFAVRGGDGREQQPLQLRIVQLFGQRLA